MRRFIDIITESQLAFFNSPFIQAVNAWCEEEGADVDTPDDQEVYWDSGSWRLVLRYHGEGTVCIEHIQVGSDFSDEGRRAGTGTHIMNAVCALADQYKIRLVLQADESNDAIGDEPDEDEGDYDEREHWLQTWYSGFGFDYTGDTGDYGPWMERQPNP